MDKVKDVLKCNEVIPNQLHQAILALNPCHIITTNYDDLLEQEIKNEFKQYALIRDDKDMPGMEYPNALIKMHGDYEKDNIVLSENDYYDYAKNFPLIRSFVLSLFASKLVVFIGFSFSDLNLKMILNEVKSNLSDKMQNVYLISTTRPDDATKEYYYQKKINIVYFDDNELKSLLQPSTVISDNVKDPLGKKLLEILTVILSYSKASEADLVSYLYDKIESYKDEIKVFGDGLKYLLPKDSYEFWNPHSGGLQLFSSYFQGLAEQLKSYSGKKKFIQDHPQIDRKNLKRFAYYNYLYRIDDLTILDPYFKSHINKYFTTSVQSYLYDFNFNKFHERMRVLSSRDLSCSNDDLEYPFALYKLGDYYGAYKIYDKISQLAWSKKKYIIYFICLCNMKMIMYPIQSQIYGTFIDSDSVMKKIKNIDLDKILNSLQINEEIRKIFQDYISYREIGSKSVETEELKEKIDQQKKSAEKGGGSINSNIQSLIAKFTREFQFCNNNFIICDNNMYYKTVCKNTVIGILNSFATPSTSFGKSTFPSTKIEKLDSNNIFVIMFSVTAEDFLNILNQYEIKSLSLDEDAIKSINKYLSNLDKTKNIPYINTSDFMNQIGNLLYILSYTTTSEIDNQLIYSLIIRFWKELLNFSVLEHVLATIIDQYKPNADNTEKILTKLLYQTDTPERFSACYFQISSLYKVHNIKLKECNIRDFKGRHLANFIHPILSIMNDTQKEEFTDYCLNNISEINPYLKFIYNNEIELSSSEKFKELLSKVHFYFESNRAFCCSTLVKIRSMHQYECLFPAIDDYARENECMIFFTDPINYNKPENVNIDWLYMCDDEQLKELAKKQVYREIMKKYLADTYKGPAISKSFLKFL
jgi:hypothetical protein